jgi:hypothetical protein
MNRPIESEEDLQPFMSMITDMQEFLKIKEPASNYDMPIRYRKQAEE